MFFGESGKARQLPSFPAPMEAAMGQSIPQISTSGAATSA
jgi:hypothetical protein